jgi:hypothetical protein
MQMRRRIIVLAIVALALPAAACGSGDDASREDAHDVRGNLVDKSRPHIATFNNRFPNVSTKCLGAPSKDVDGAPQGNRDENDTAATGGGWRVVVTTNKAILLVQDPACPGYRKGTSPQVVTAAPATKVTDGNTP